MAGSDIAAAVARAAQVFVAKPAAALQPDRPALARWIGGLKVEARADGDAAVVTDLTAALGGAGEGVTPGWLARAALASCAATCVALAAARAGIALERLEAEARSRSDARGLLGLEDASGRIDPGPGEIELVVRLAAPGATSAQLEALAAEAQAVSPVTALFEQARPVRLTIETGT